MPINSDVTRLLAIKCPIILFVNSQTAKLLDDSLFWLMMCKKDFSELYFGEGVDFKELYKLYAERTIWFHSPNCTCGISSEHCIRTLHDKFKLDINTLREMAFKYLNYDILEKFSHDVNLTRSVKQKKIAELRSSYDIDNMPFDELLTIPPVRDNVRTNIQNYVQKIVKTYCIDSEIINEMFTWYYRFQFDDKINYGNIVVTSKNSQVTCHDVSEYEFVAANKHMVIVGAR